MSGISKTIERVKELHGIYMKRSYSLDETTTGWTELKTKQWEAFKTEALSAIMPIITAYEQSQKELEKVDDLCEGADDYFKMKADLDTANKRIAELEKLLKRVEPMAASGLYREITEVLYVVKGA